MKNKSIYIKFIITILISGTIGGFCGVFMGSNEHSLQQLGKNINDYILKHAGIIDISLGSIMALIVLTLIIVSHYKYRYIDQDQEDETVLESFEQSCDRIIAFNSINMVFQYIMYGILINSIPRTNDMFYVIWFLLMLAFMVTVQVRTINRVKKYNPTKKAHPLEFQFQKKWMESCDEAEKFVIYAASYHVYMIMSHTLVIIAVVLMLCNMIGNIGVLPFFIVGVLWMVQVTSYYVWVKRLSKQKINY